MLILQNSSYTNKDYKPTKELTFMHKASPSTKTNYPFHQISTKLIVVMHK